MPEPSPEDITLLTEYVNTMDLKDALEYLETGDCLVELAWLETARREAVGQWRVAVATAYASARGELNSIRLTHPEVDGDA